MARITVENCLKTGVYDKFDLVLIAAQRTKQLNAGAHTEVEREVKNTLRSLMEIEENKVSVDELRDAVIHSYQKYEKPTEEEKEDVYDDVFIENVDDEKEDASDEDLDDESEDIEDDDIDDDSDDDDDIDLDDSDDDTDDEEDDKDDDLDLDKK